MQKSCFSRLTRIAQHSHNVTQGTGSLCQSTIAHLLYEIGENVCNKDLFGSPCQGTDVPEHNTSLHTSNVGLWQGQLLSPMMQHALRESLQQSSWNQSQMCNVYEAATLVEEPVPMYEPGQEQHVELPAAQPENIVEPVSSPTLIAKKRGTSYQPSRRKRLNKHGLEKR